MSLHLIQFRVGSVINVLCVLAEGLATVDCLQTRIDSSDNVSVGVSLYPLKMDVNPLKENFEPTIHIRLVVS